MHGRRKESADSIPEAKKRAMRSKLDKYVGLVQTCFALKNANQKTEEALTVTTHLLGANPENYNIWNYRREILETLWGNLTLPEKVPRFDEELLLVAASLKQNPKVYCLWEHRKWVVRQYQACWPREFELVAEFHQADDRNFHCWNYRQFLCRLTGQSADAEFAYSTTRINHNFSNYSAWHYRSILLPRIHRASASLPASVLESASPAAEIDYATQAVFTDPKDQSTWWYLRWCFEHLSDDGDQFVDRSRSVTGDCRRRPTDAASRDRSDLLVQVASVRRGIQCERSSTASTESTASTLNANGPGFDGIVFAFREPVRVIGRARSVDRSESSSCQSSTTNTKNGTVSTSWVIETPNQSRPAQLASHFGSMMDSNASAAADTLSTVGRRYILTIADILPLADHHPTTDCVDSTSADSSFSFSSSFSSSSSSSSWICVAPDSTTRTSFSPVWILPIPPIIDRSSTTLTEPNHDCNAGDESSSLSASTSLLSLNEVHKHSGHRGGVNPSFSFTVHESAYDEQLNAVVGSANESDSSITEDSGRGEGGGGGGAGSISELDLPKVVSIAGPQSSTLSSVVLESCAVISGSGELSVLHVRIPEQSDVTPSFFTHSPGSDISGNDGCRDSGDGGDSIVVLAHGSLPPAMIAQTTKTPATDSATSSFPVSNVFRFDGEWEISAEGFRTSSLPSCRPTAPSAANSPPHSSSSSSSWVRFVPRNRSSTATTANIPQYCRELLAIGSGADSSSDSPPDSADGLNCESSSFTLTLLVRRRSGTESTIPVPIVRQNVLADVPRGFREHSESVLGAIDELLEVEPDAKWGILTRLWLYHELRLTRDWIVGRWVHSTLDHLAQLDRSHRPYYEDLRSRYVTDSLLDELLTLRHSTGTAVDIRHVSLVDANLTVLSPRLCVFDRVFVAGNRIRWGSDRAERGTLKYLNVSS